MIYLVLVGCLDCPYFDAYINIILHTLQNSLQSFVLFLSGPPQRFLQHLFSHLMPNSFQLYTSFILFRETRKLLWKLHKFLLSFTAFISVQINRIPHTFRLWVNALQFLIYSNQCSILFPLSLTIITISNNTHKYHHDDFIVYS